MQRSTLALSVLGVVSVAGSALAAPFTFALGGGWEVTVADDTISTVSPLNAGTALGDGEVRLNTSVNFNSIDPSTGGPQPLTFTFRQVAPDASTVSRIVLDAESLVNLTGQAWIGFRHVVALSSNTNFDVTLSGARSINPFTSQTFSANSREVTVGGGTVNSGSTWSPGQVNGGLVINANVNASSAPIVFTLKEIPLVPTPGTAALLGLGGLAMGRRRR